MIIEINKSNEWAICNHFASIAKNYSTKGYDYKSALSSPGKRGCFTNKFYKEVNLLSAVDHNYVIVSEGISKDILDILQNIF